MHGILRNVNFVAQAISRTTDCEQIPSASTIQGYSSVTSLHGEKLLFEGPRGEEGPITQYKRSHTPFKGSCVRNLDNDELLV